MRSSLICWNEDWMRRSCDASPRTSTRGFAKRCGGISLKPPGSAVRPIIRGMLLGRFLRKLERKCMPDCGISSLVRIFDNAPDEERAWQRAEWLKDEWRSRFPELVEWMEETLHDPLAVFSLPREHRLRMRTNPGLERFHEEMRRRTRVVRIFPNRMSCLRLCTALSMEQSEEWITGHRYLDMEVLEEEQPELVELPKKEAVLA